ncbi:MAG TPA: tRNA adenosine(34) deaminase TadA [Clostridiales bacterium]|jgi:tRNA(adenine34) deaminase|nr:tRNA adenosine(34) deaminase TadA [Clostridiales bacterium]HRT82086.1 tRNA adenosine(34) deaminase TadA [Oscillospiraceae bacterium]
MDDRFYMEECLRLAKEAASRGEVPVGAIVVRNGQIIGRGQNRREADKNALAHAEIEAIEAACRFLGGWRLWECDLYVTLEPCPMCAGAIINSRIRRLVFGAHDPKAGACGSVVNLFDLPFNHKPETVAGLMAEECSKELTDFFADLRSKNKEEA